MISQCGHCGALSHGERFCTNCGSPIAAPSTAEPTTGRPGGIRSTVGRRRGAQPPAQGGVPPMTPPGTAGDPFAAVTARTSAFPQAPGAPASQPREPHVQRHVAPTQRRGRAGKLLVLAGVLALLGVGAFTVRGMLGGGGGAESPEAAVQELANAVNSEDPAAVAATLAPDEVRALGDVIGAVERQARKVGIAGRGSPYEGLDVRLDDLELDAQELGPDVAKVTIRQGTLGLRVSEGGLTPAGKELAREGELDELEPVDVDDFSDEDEGPYIGGDP